MNAKELHQILKNNILNGIYTEQLPSIADFIRTFSVSHNTVKKVVDRLKMENLVYGRKGKGCFVKKQGINAPERTIVFYLALSVLSNHFYANMLTELKRQLEEKGFAVKIRSILTSPECKFLACAFIGSVISEDDLEDFYKENPPEYTLWINRYLPGHLTVCCDNRCGSEIALKHLYDQGHRHIGVLSCDVTGFDQTNIFYHRRQGVVKFVQTHPDVVVSEIETASSAVSTENFEAGFLQKDPEITAIFCFTDMLALRLYNTVENIGKYSIIGYDNRDFTSLLVPALTTVEENGSIMAEELTGMMQKMSNHESIESVLVSPFLVERESVFAVE